MKAYIPKLVRFIVLTLVVGSVFCHGVQAGGNDQLSKCPNRDELTGIVNPFDSTCYDWRGHIIPCDFRRPYVDILLDKPSITPRFSDNQDGTVTDNLTKLIWLKNPDCFGMIDWTSAMQAAKGLKNGHCGADPAIALSDGSFAGDWRLPTMSELCTLIDFRRRDPALPEGHPFGEILPGYHWSATKLDAHSRLAWIVYFESGTTCYEDIENRAGHVWPVRGPVK